MGTNITIGKKLLRVPLLCWICPQSLFAGHLSPSLIPHGTCLVPSQPSWTERRSRLDTVFQVQPHRHTARGITSFLDLPQRQNFAFLHARSPEVAVAEWWNGMVSSHGPWKFGLGFHLRLLCRAQQWRMNHCLLTVYSLILSITKHSTKLILSEEKSDCTWRGYDSIHYLICFLSSFHCIPSQLLLQIAVWFV